MHGRTVWDAVPLTFRLVTDNLLLNRANMAKIQILGGESSFGGEVTRGKITSGCNDSNSYVAQFSHYT